ncbi:transposase [Aeromonas caviae]|uniref:transposase n=1 Tax=Aeromonas caviae TaxID=648 RepID=UPI00396AF6EB
MAIICRVLAGQGWRSYLRSRATPRSYEGMVKPAFNWVNTMIGNVKNSLRGSCHTLGAKHLPRHLAEYCFRFNHRFDLKSMFVELGHAVVASPPMPYRLLKLAEGHG